MECNKDEAVKAKEIAEKKFLSKDLPGARRFALKAQNLYPGLEGISQFVATLDVHIAAENKIFGESDWYEILGVDPQADDEAVRKQYRKLALILHPDKNKSVGADGAFKCISEAWSVFSDKLRRSVYDQKWKTAKAPAKFSSPAGTSSMKPAPSGSSAKPRAKPPKSTPRAKQPSTPAPSQKPKPKTKSKLSSFWSVCYRCKMQFEYLKKYLNQSLLCPSCREPFLAVEIPPPLSHSSRNSNTWRHSPLRHNVNATSSRGNSVNPTGHGPSGQTNFQWAPFSGPASSGQTNFQWAPFSGPGSSGQTTPVAQAAKVVPQAGEKVKKVSKRAAAGEHSGESKRRKKSEGVVLGNKGGNAVPGVEARNHDFSATTSRVDGVNRPFGYREVPQVGLQTMLMERARGEILNKIGEWNFINATKIADGDDNGARIINETDAGKKSQVTVDTCDQAEDGKFPSAPSGSKAAVETPQTLSINVPDPDFHNFDQDRTEGCFGDNQVWAAYDGKDGMPRLYAVIHNVISVDPFLIKISWLNSRSNSELGPINWIGSGFSKTCGEFRVGKYEIYDSLNSFSHMVKWTKGARGVVCIYPKKGEVWALYRNWSPDWNELTAEEVVYKYDMVEVLEDFNEKEGVTVAPLVKVAGFKTVFHRHLDPKEIRSIPTQEMFRFSHIVPSYLLTGQEGENAPKGCRELDPAATPVDLLEVAVDVKDGCNLNNDEESKEEER